MLGSKMLPLLVAVAFASANACAALSEAAVGPAQPKMMSLRALSMAPATDRWRSGIERCTMDEAELKNWGEPVEDKVCGDPLANMTAGARPQLNAAWRHPCKLEWLYQEGICEAVNKTHIIFIGDSLTRHVFDAAMVLLRDDPHHGYLPEDAETDVVDRCSCGKMFAEEKKGCREYGASYKGTPELRKEWTGSEESTPYIYHSAVCNTRAMVTIMHVYKYWKHDTHTKDTLSHLKRLLKETGNDTYVFLGGHPLHSQRPGQKNGAGILDAGFFCENLVNGTVDVLEEVNLPMSHLLISNMHHTEPSKFDERWEKWGVRLPKLPLIKAYNEAITECIQRRSKDLRIFDAFSLTANISSSDGFHYPMGPNLQKAQLVFHNLRHLKQTKKW